MPQPPPLDRLGQRDARDQRGQASLEYLAVVGLVAIVLGVIGTITVGPSIANGVGEAFQRAICRLSGDGCRALVRQACVVRTTGTDVDASVKFTLIKLGRSTALLRSVRSDGTVDVTLLDRLKGELEAKVGAEGRLQFGGRAFGGSAMALAALVAELGGGRVWRVADNAAADRLQDKLIEVIIGKASSAIPGVGLLFTAAQEVLDVGRGKDLPPPTSRIVSARVGGKATLDGPFGADLKLAAGAELGGSLNAAGGGTVYLKVDGSAGADLLAGAAGLSLGGDAKVALTLDHRGNPVTLTLTGNGKVQGTKTKSSDSGGDRLTFARSRKREGSAQLTATLDLTVPENAAAAQRLVKALRPGRAVELPDAVRALGGAIASGARLDLARYRKSERRYGGNVDASLGLGVGAGLDVVLTGGELADALTRPPGGAWERRADCLARA